MGIPTVKRKVKSYLAETLRSLIDKLSPEEKLDCVIIVYVGEVRSPMHSMSHSISPLLQNDWQIAVRRPNVLSCLISADRCGLCAQRGGWSRERVSTFTERETVKEWKHTSWCVRPLLTSPTTLLLFRFSTELSSGLLEVISPPPAYYPDLTNLKETFGDSRERVK